jgi:CMP-N-acetylneuraminic acid synthetase
MKILGVITARGGSKGIPRKNLVPVGGRPLLAYTAEAALGARTLSRTILSTDDDEIAALGLRLGLEVPFLRPAELAQDHTPTLPVLQHAVSWLEERGDRYDAVCLLQPTNPFRDSAVIDGCARLFETARADSVVTVLHVPNEYNPHWVYFEDVEGCLRLSTGEANPIPRRQELPRAFHREGSVYITRRDVLIEESSLYGRRVLGFLVDHSRAVNIDEYLDLEIANAIAASLPAQ